MLNLLIKPASSNCNMRCRYCFYADESENRTVASFGIMPLDTLEAVVQKALQYAEKECTFAFQGGEPLLAGLPFYTQLIHFQKKYNTKRLHIHNAIQTNGFCVNDAWAQFFAQHKFLVGLSLDGPKDINDLYRTIDSDAENGSFGQIMKTVQLFNKYGVMYNILTVVTATTARHIGKIYGFFKRSGFMYQQYIPCLDPFGEPRGQQPYALTPALYTRFLITLFDLWYADAVRGEWISIRLFDNLLLMLQRRPPETCGMLGFCTCQYVLEADGSVYPCDFYVMDPYRIGNLVTDSFDMLEAQRKNIGFIETSLQVDEACKSCTYAHFCRGGCRRDREPVTDGKLALNYYCSAFKTFYPYALPKLSKLNQQVAYRSQ